MNIAYIPTLLPCLVSLFLSSSSKVSESHRTSTQVLARLGQTIFSLNFCNNTRRHAGKENEDHGHFKQKKEERKIIKLLFTTPTF